MLEDCISAVLLAALLPLVAPAESARLRQTITTWWGGLPTISLAARLRSLWGHPAGRLVLLGALLMTMGWASLAMHLGPANASRVMAGQAVSAPAEARVCHRFQAQTWEMLRERHDGFHQTPDSAKARQLRPTDYGSCPYGGVYELDDEGYLSCSRHGRHPSLAPLVPPEGKRP